MALDHDTMINPPIESLLDKVDSKFTPGHAGGAPRPEHQLLLQPAR